MTFNWYKALIGFGMSLIMIVLALCAIALVSMLPFALQVAAILGLLCISFYLEGRT